MSKLQEMHGFLEHKKLCRFLGDVHFLCINSQLVISCHYRGKMDTLAFDLTFLYLLDFGHNQSSMIEMLLHRGGDILAGTYNHGEVETYAGFLQA